MVHTDRHLFIGDWSSHSILVYFLERNWAFVSALGSKGKGAGQFQYPRGMCLCHDRLIVCDCENDRLQFIDISAADAKDWRFDAPFGAEGSGEGHLSQPVAVCYADGALLVAERRENRVRSFGVAVCGAARTLVLTPRASIHGCDYPWGFTADPYSPRVFVADVKQISCIDLQSGAVRPFVTITGGQALRFTNGLLYVVHNDRLSVFHADTDTGSGAVQQSGVESLSGQTWTSAYGIDVLSDFVLIADAASQCVHVIPSS